MKNLNLPIFLAISTSLFLYACANSDTVTPNDSTQWLVPSNEIRNGGPDKDGIPALENPTFTSSSSVNYLSNDDLILGYVSGDSAKAYPHAILDWHEIINDQINGKNIAVTYCPLTATGIGWDRNISGTVSTFGVSGLIYNTNLIPYDRATNSNWSQIRRDSINGERIGTKIVTHQLVETTWGTWKEMYPNTTVISEETGYDRNYGAYPYGDYKTNHNKVIFPVSNSDSRLPNKERVHGIVINNNAKVYSIESFDNTTKVIQDNFASTPIVVVGNKSKNFIVSFNRTLNGTTLDFEAIEDALPLILLDNEGNFWDIFGNASKGPRTGEKLTSTTSFMGFWLGWVAFYPAAEIYDK